MSDPNYQGKGMEYNSNRELLVIPEYGRNVQKLINHAKTIENKEERQLFVERIVRLMQQMHPQSGNIDDYRERLWKHVFYIADFELDVDPPMGKKPTREEIRKKPEAIPYPIKEAKFRHYGHNVQQLIKKALSMAEGAKREGFAAAIAAYMKLAYKTWNKEHYVSDDIIKSDIASLSNGGIKLDDDAGIDFLSSPNKRRSSSSSSSSRRSSSSNGSGGGHKRGSRSNYRRKR
jgi:hypothetical protein